jgi:hypothetical protein
LKLVSQRRPSKDFFQATARWLFFVDSQDLDVMFQ